MCMCCLTHTGAPTTEDSSAAKKAKLDEGAGDSQKGCPNKWNKWHECADFCQQRWGEKLPSKSSTEPELVLPSGWK